MYDHMYVRTRARRRVIRGRGRDFPLPTCACSSIMSLFRQTGEPGQRDMLKGVNDSLVAGSVSGALTRLCTCPLDVLKIRFQLQLEPIKQVESTRLSSD